MSLSLINYSTFISNPVDNLGIDLNGNLVKISPNGHIILAHFDENYGLNVQTLVEIISGKENIINLGDQLISDPFLPSFNSYLLENGTLCLLPVDIVKGFNQLGESAPDFDANITARYYRFLYKPQSINGTMDIVYLESWIGEKVLLKDVCRIRQDNRNIQFFHHFVPDNIFNVVGTNILTPLQWFDITCAVYYNESIDTSIMKIYVDGVEEASYTIPTATSKPTLGHNTSPYNLAVAIGGFWVNMDEFHVANHKQETPPAVLTEPIKPFYDGEIVATVTVDCCQTEPVVWRLNTIDFLHDVSEEFRYRVDSFDSGDPEFTGTKLTLEELKALDNVEGRYVAFEITYPSDQSQFMHPFGWIEWLPSSRDYYSSPIDVKYYCGIKYTDLELEDEGELDVVLINWLSEATQYINNYCHTSWVNPPQDIKKVATRIVCNMCGLAIQKRKTSIIQVGNFTVQLLEDDLVSDDMKEVLDLHQINAPTTIGFGTITPEDTEDE